MPSFNVPFDPPDCSDFSAEEIARLSQVVERWRGEPASLLTMLLEIQEIWGYLPQRALEHVSHILRSRPAADGRGRKKLSRACPLGLSGSLRRATMPLAWGVPVPDPPPFFPND